VARGSLGTAANLEETQVLRTEDLRSWAAAAEARQEAAAESEPPAAESEAEPAAIAGAMSPPAVAAPVPPPAESASASVRPRDRFAGLAGVLAAVFVILAGATFLLTRHDQPGGTGGAAVPSPTAAPAATKEPKGDKGKGNGNDHGNGGGGD
jgi:hypothetical protein